MSTLVKPSPRLANDYPTRDGRPMAETDLHYLSITTARTTLEHLFADQPLTYVSGNLLLFYEPGNKRRHVAPDIFVVKGVPKGIRDNYLVWEEGKGPDVVFEFTSKTTKNEDLEEKFVIYEKKLCVPEYFLFDPRKEYLDPSLRGYRLRQGKYVPIRPLKGRLPSQVLGLHVERAGVHLRFFDPATKEWLPTREERIARAEAETARLRQELDELRRRTAGRG